MKMYVAWLAEDGVQFKEFEANPAYDGITAKMRVRFHDDPLAALGSLRQSLVEAAAFVEEKIAEIEGQR